MENPVEYLNVRMKKEMIMICYALREGHPSVSCLNLDPSTYEKKAMAKLEETPLYDHLAKLIAKSTTPFSITNFTCLSNAILGYEAIIPLLQNREVKSLARHCLASTQANLANLEKISTAKEIKKHVGLDK